jgi:spore coat polysaccharide biosynthesis protein SpsF
VIANFNTYNAIIYARFNSTRLPGKVLFTLGDETIIGLCVNKLKAIPGLRIIVATSDARSDDPVARWCDQNNVQVFRGALDNVAQRTRDCLQQFPCQAFFRINADSPFLQTALLRQAISIFDADKSLDVISNVVERSYPYGIAVELINSRTFQTHVGYFQGEQLEHITSYFYKTNTRFNIAVIKNPEDLSTYRFVLDTEQDWKQIQEFYRNDTRIFNCNLSELITINNNTNNRT